jgi:hypothetical protein
MGWVPIPTGQTIVVVKGAAYAVVASVSTSHQRGPILNQLEKMGLAVYSFLEGPVVDGYRLVSIAATANQGGLD